MKPISLPSSENPMTPTPTANEVLYNKYYIYINNHGAHEMIPTSLTPRPHTDPVAIQTASNTIKSSHPSPGFPISNLCLLQSIIEYADISPTTLNTHKACTDPNLYLQAPYPNDTGFRGFVDWTRECDVPDQASPKQCSSDPNPERLYRSAVDIAVDNDVECAADAVKNTTRGVFPQVISLPLLTHLPRSIRHGKIRVNHDTHITRKSPHERVRHAYMNIQAVREPCIEKPIKNAFHTQTNRQTSTKAPCQNALSPISDLSLSDPLAADSDLSPSQASCTTYKHFTYGAHIPGSN